MSSRSKEHSKAFYRILNLGQLNLRASVVKVVGNKRSEENEVGSLPRDSKSRGAINLGLNTSRCNLDSTALPRVNFHFHTSIAVE